MSTKNKPKTIKEKYNLNDSYELIYVDYQDCLEDHNDIEIIIQEGNCGFLWEEDWWFESRVESTDYIIKELEEEYGEISDEDREEILSYLEENDDSNPVKELIRNTPSQYFYYSLGYTIEDHDAHVHCEEDCVEKEVKKIMKILRTNNPETKKSVREVVLNAGYGGELVILFEDDLDNLLNDRKVIGFNSNAEICIMDRAGGSGCSAPLNIAIACEFNRENLHSDEGAPGYSFSGDVCGLIKGFMGNCSIRNQKKTDKLIKVKLSPEEEEFFKKERFYEKQWKEGKCTFGDMNIKRHKNTPYRNEFPCGNKCTECGTFWID